MGSMYDERELQKIGFISVGANVNISKKASIYSPETIRIGNNVRIDDFTILSGRIDIGNYVHISAYTGLYGGGGIKIGDFCGCSPKTIIFSASDDFSGEYMISPLAPKDLCNVERAEVVLENFTQLGAGTIVFPGVHIGEGSVTGAMTLVNKSLDPWGVYIGVPSKYLKPRSKKIKELSKNVK